MFDYKFRRGDRSVTGTGLFLMPLLRASKSKPKDGKLPGYFFYQTKDGFKFKSIDKLISDGKKSEQIVYEEVNYKPSSKLSEYVEFNIFGGRLRNLIRKLGIPSRIFRILRSSSESLGSSSEASESLCSFFSILEILRNHIRSVRIFIRTFGVTIRIFWILIRIAESSTESSGSWGSWLESLDSSESSSDSFELSADSQEV